LNIPQDIYKCLGFNVVAEVVPVEIGEVAGVLKDLKRLIDEGKCRISNREKNKRLLRTYVISDALRFEILKELEEKDFKVKLLDKSEVGVERVEKGFSQEYLYVFKCKRILVFSTESESSGREKEVSLFIKVNNRKEPGEALIIVSFHEDD